MAAVLKVGDLELCEYCIKGSAIYDFTRRCCLARHTLMLPKPKRVATYAHTAEKLGQAAARQLMDDVQKLYALRKSFDTEGEPA